MIDRRQTFASNLLLFEAAGRVLRALASEGARAAPIKGAWLLEHVHHDLSARAMCDVDLLVDPAERAAVGRAMDRAGIESDPMPTNRPFTIRTQYHSGYHVRLGETRVHVELHFGLAQTWRVDIPVGEVLDRARPSSLQGEPCLRLADRDQVCIILCHIGLHLFMGGERAFRDLVDLRRAGLLDDIPCTLERCRSWGCVTMAWAALDLMNEAFPDLAVELPGRFAPSLSHRAYLALALRRGSSPGFRFTPRSRWGHVAHYLALADNGKRRARLLADYPYRRTRDAVETLWRSVRGG